MNEDIVKDETAGFEVVTSDMPEVAAPEEVKNEVTEEIKPEVTEEIKTGEGEVTEAVKTDAAKEDEKKGEVKRPSRRDRRIDKLIRAREDTKRENEKLQERLAALEAAPAKKDLSEDDFDTYDEYLVALDEADNSKVEKKIEKVERQSNQNDAPPSLTDTQQSAMAVLREAFDVDEKPADFEKIAMNPELAVTGEMLEALAECDDPVGVMYHLGQHKDVAADIAALSPVQQMREIARLDIKGVKPIKPVKITASSPPISPVGSAGAQQKTVGEMSFSEYEKYMNKKDRVPASW